MEQIPIKICNVYAVDQVPTKIDPPGGYFQHEELKRE